MVDVTNIEHSSRMRTLVKFTRSSFKSDLPSPFGAAIYDLGTGELLAQAYGSGVEESDPSGHAEVKVIRETCQKSQRYSLKGCILYSTCEPCAMCMYTGILAEVDMVVYGASAMGDADKYWAQRSDVTAKELASRIIYGPECQVVSEVELKLCQDLFKESDIVCKQKGARLSPKTL